MKLVIQRVESASVEVEGEVVSNIGLGLVILVGVRRGDTIKQARHLADKVVKLRLWPDNEKPGALWKSSVADNGYKVLVVSQFTLFATFTKPKPNFVSAMAAEEARLLYEEFVVQLRRNLGEEKVATGIFGAHMQVSLRNDGPVTVELDAVSDTPITLPSDNSVCANSVECATSGLSALTLIVIFQISLKLWRIFQKVGRARREPFMKL
eukprot:gnl/TRDRNA2_/TRDRNA2_201071_c0_seq1.p1 gnl/TRDRNA2_/TRDRNA2_201071_c0~~gnl/TRDRNA2_/TRDRNA2_201071_c0_seq1.p1  ORF type:complete len:209 (-),score=36.15 gnl/TRDRNA2_/TRDRNA2_201071_c0_seq1:529-1155(-)